MSTCISRVPIDKRRSNCAQRVLRRLGRTGERSCNLILSYHSIGVPRFGEFCVRLRYRGVLNFDAPTMVDESPYVGQELEKASSSVPYRELTPEEAHIARFMRQGLITSEHVERYRRIPTTVRLRRLPWFTSYSSSLFDVPHLHPKEDRLLSREEFRLLDRNDLFESFIVDALTQEWDSDYESRYDPRTKTFEGRFTTGHSVKTFDFSKWKPKRNDAYERWKRRTSFLG